MKVAVILNGVSMEKKFFHRVLLPALQTICDPEVFETTSRNDAITLASKAVDLRSDVILSAGGDGTLFQVLNGVLQGREKQRNLPLLGLIPLGSGNDFGRTISASKDPNVLIEMLKNRHVRELNVGNVHFTSDAGTAEQRYFINVADIGMGPEVVRKVWRSGKTFGSGVAYYKSILSTFLTYRMMEVEAKSENWHWKNKVRTFAVANGKYYGHGLCIAPDAVPDDDVFEVFACADASIIDFIIQSIPLKKGLHVKHPKVSYSKAKSVQLTSSKPCAIEADGEWLGWLPAKVEVAPLKVKFLVRA